MEFWPDGPGRPRLRPPHPVLCWRTRSGAARRCVERLEEQGAEVIVCLSHGGTSPDGTSEDEELARAVEGST